MADWRIILATGIFLFLASASLRAQGLQELVSRAESSQGGQEEKPIQAAPEEQNAGAPKIKPVEDVFQFKETPKLHGYTYDLKRLLEVARENIRKVNEEIALEEMRRRNEARETQIVKYFEKGNQLYKEGKLKEAKQEWEKAVSVSKNPEMKQYIEESSRQSRIEEKRLKKQEAAVRKAHMAAEDQELKRIAKIAAQNRREGMRAERLKKARLTAVERAFAALAPG